MGLFDTLFIEKKLPLPPEVAKLKVNWKNEPFQTKDLECFMLTYKVNRAGRLLHLEQKTKWVEDKGRFGGHLDVISERWVKYPHTGEVIFYTSVCSAPQEKEGTLYDLVPQEQIDNAKGFDYALDFKGKFVNGELVDLTLHRIDGYPIKEHLIRHNEWVKDLQVKHSKLSYKIKSFLRKNIPNHGYQKTISMLNKFITFQQRLVTKLY